MVGIYEDVFIDYLKENLGEPVKVTAKNIVCRCCWCEMNTEKKHYHLWISLDAPIFHCFYAGCEQSGTISKLVKHISGVDSSDNFVSKEKIKENINKRISFDKNVDIFDVTLPDLKEHLFSHKVRYLKRRLKFSNINIKSINGLIFDVNEFININNISVDPTLFRIRDFLQSNFIGFVTQHNSLVILRNIDPTSSFRHFKMSIHPSKFLDYYKLSGSMKNSTRVILAEGIFDIYTEHIFDTLNLKNTSCLYASGLSTSYQALLKSIAYYENIFRMDVHILSDSNVQLDYYKKIKRYNSHLIEKLTVYYNRMGKDFNDSPIVVEKFIT